ncbi:BcNRPS1, nonribosomal peptide synthetase [Sclerotinia borealis F-4128]|uniref:BcNRPS1, nonribosomal peptide synthetase n=1 Tax=Sclerotinia borealis (strain F-4128) TaxID=1432307 RepID=W9CJ95_SCLBF|nr:BcNRPS1, nonribosomal peptide synthetase [Sclerotinia borealis F-4128]
MSPFIDVIGNSALTKRNMVEGTSGMIPSKKEALILSHLCSILELSTTKVDLDSNFVGLGGHSLMAIKLSKACKKDGLTLSIPSILLSPTLTQLIESATETRAISSTNILKNSHDLNTPVSPTRSSHERQISFSRTTPSNRYATSASNLSITEMQHSFMHSYQRQPGSNIISFYETYSSANVPIMKMAWKTVIDSESIFRTIFDHDKATATHSKQPLPFVWDEIFVEDTDTYISELEKEIVPAKMEVTFTVLTPRTQRSGNVGVSTIVWRVHHAFIDGYSANLLYEKVRKIVMGQNIVSGTPFSSVIHEVQKYQQMNREVSRSFWRKQMELHPSPVGDLSLPVPSSSSKSSRNADVSFTIPSEEISAAARSAGVSLASWFQAAWGLALSMYADSDTVVFGTVLSGRNLPIPGMDDTIGPFINTLPFHVSLDRSQTALEYVQSVFRHSVELSSFQHSLPEDGYSRQFASALAMEFDMQPTDDHKVRPIGQSWFKVVPDIPLSIFMTTTGTIRMSYQTQKYTDSDIELLSENFQTAILSLLSPTKSVGECLSNLLSTKSHETLMKMGNCLTEETSPASIKDDLVTLFERAAAENPSVLAVEKAEQSLTYQEFNKMATKLSAQLSKHVQPGDIVCVHADRSINWLVAIYGILKSGAVYSAQDAALPGHIREANFQTAGGKLFLTPASSQRSIAPASCQLCLSVEDLVQLPLPSSVVVAPRQLPRPADNAYLCFTSGSTGKPKGVMCSHEGLVAFQKDLAVRLFALPGQRISQLMSPAFDGSIHEIFSALSYGATIVLADGIHPFSHLEKATAAILTPSIANILDPEDYPMLRNVYLVGEPVPQHVNDVWSGVKNLYNMYGPTEATCGATIKRLLPGKSVNIGAPNPTTRVYILDRNQQLLPPGVIGEIYLAGVQVARGYIGMPQMTAERFLSDTICNRTGEMMYRTGDRGYFNRGGEVECLGRNDRQIKLRGFRLDLNDLEIRVAEAIPECSGIAICQKGDYLVAMVSPETLDIGKVRAKVTKVLPVHAVPRIFMAVEKFPMTPAGKLDHKAITTMTMAKEESVPKKIESSTETRMAQAWKELLGLEANVEITKDSEFISLGGHSVMQLRLASKLSEIFAVKMTVSHIMQSANLFEMAKTIDDLRAQGQPIDVTDGLVPLGNYRVSPIEREWFEKYRLNVGTSSFNVTYACSIDSNVVDTDKLISAWNTVLARHRILRCRYVKTGPKGSVRRGYDRFPPQIKTVNKLGLWRECNRPFDLERQHPIRVFLSRNTMLASMSHIIADLTSLEVLLKEVTTLYSGKSLPPIEHTYMDTTQWSTPATPTESKWWKEYLHGASQSYTLPNLSQRITYAGRTRLTKLPRELTHQILKFADEQKVTLHQLALGAVALSLQHDQNDIDIVLGGPYFNRGAQDLDTVGLFLEPLPIRIRHPSSSTSTSTSTKSYLHSVQTSSQAAIAHAMPWDQILNSTTSKTHFPNHPLLDIMVTFHDHRTPKTSIEGMNPLITYTEGSKFALLVEFSVISDQAIALRMEYDTKCVSKEEIVAFEAVLFEAVRGLIGGCGLEDVKRGLEDVKRGLEVVKREVCHSGDGRELAPPSYFGKSLETLSL